MCKYSINKHCFYCEEPYGDEFHLFLTCHAFKQERQKFFNTKVFNANVLNFKNAVSCETLETATFMKSIILTLNFNK